MGLMHSFHFLHPVWLLGLPAALAIALWFTRHKARDAAWSRVIDAPLLNKLQLGEFRRGLSPWWLIASLWSLCAIALAGPAWEHVPAAGYRTPAGWVMLLDLSPSMSKQDVMPDRSTRARYAATDVLAAAHGARVGLIGFAGEAYTVSPLTSDIATVRSLLRPLSPRLMPEQGDQLAPALDQAGQLVQGASVPRAQIIVFSDGTSDAAAAIEHAARMHALGMTVDVVAIGNDAHAADELKRVASAGGGEYVALNDLPRLIADLKPTDNVNFDSPSLRPDGNLTQWRNGGIWLLPVILMMGALLARRGWV